MEKDAIKNLIIPPQIWTNIKYKKPYILTLKNKKQELLCFGLEHSKNPRDEQFVRIEKLFNKFISRNSFKKNMVILTEGALLKKVEEKEKMIEKYGEIGILTYLAKKNEIEIESIEPLFKEMIKVTKEKRFKEKKIALWVAVNVLWGKLRQSKEKRNLSMEDIKKSEKNLRVIYKNIGLNILKKREEITNFLKKEFKKETKKDIFNLKITELKECQSPFLDKTTINNVSSYVNFAKDYLIAEKILKKLKLGKNIFVVLGHNHIVAQEPAFRSFFKNYPK